MLSDLRGGEVRRVAEPETVENAFRLHLGWALPGARALADEADDPFATSRRAMEAGAWHGGESDAFHQQLVGKGSSAATVADECVAALQARYAAEPPRVAATDRRARWV